MSKTFKTRPPYVRALDPNEKKVKIEEVHNHGKGYCDLPEDKSLRHTYRIEDYPDEVKRINPRNEEELLLDSSKICYHHLTTTTNICGCPMCTAQMERKLERRASRHESKAKVKTLEKEFNGGQGVDELQDDII